MNNKKAKFKIGDRIIQLSTNEKGTISKFCSDEEVIYVRWGKDKSQEMVKTSDLKKD